MTKEQEKAIETLKKFKDNELQRDKLELNRTGGWKIGDIYKFLELNPAIETVLSMLKEKDELINEQLKENTRLQEELNEENKRCMILANNDKFKEQMIDLMAEWISKRCFYKDDYSNSCEIIQDSCNKKDDCKHCIKQYFESKAINDG